MSNVLSDLRMQVEAATALFLNIKDVVGEDEEIWLTCIDGETDLIRAIGAAVDRLDTLNILMGVLEERMTEIRKRKERFEGQSERIRAAIHVALGHASLRKLELPQATLSVRAVPPKVEIIDEAAIPARFWKPQDPKLDKKGIAEALKANVPVPGATMSNGGETLSIRSV